MGVKREQRAAPKPAPERTQKPQAAAQAPQEQPDGGRRIGLTSVSVPMVPVKIPMLRVRLPRPPAPRDVAQQTTFAAQAVRANMPSTERLVYYGGLGLMAGLGVIDWPVAAVVGAGVWVASHARRRSAEGGQPSRAAQAERAATA